MSEETKIAEELDILKEFEPIRAGTTEEPAAAEVKPEEPAVEQEPPVVEESAKEPEAVEEPVKPEVVTEPPETVTEAPKTVADSTTTESEDVDWEARTKLLETELNQLSTQLMQQSVAPSPAASVAEEKKDAAPPSVAAPTPAPAPTPTDVYPFVTEDNYEQVVATPKALNQAMNAVYNRGVEANLRVMPEFVNKLIAQAFYVQTVRNKFYDGNKDLMKHADYVGVVENKVRAENPDLPLDKLFDKIAEEVRGKLGLGARKTKTPAVVVEPSNPTTVTKPPGARKPAAQIVSGIEQDIADLKDVHY